MDYEGGGREFEYTPTAGAKRARANAGEVLADGRVGTGNGPSTRWSSLTAEQKANLRPLINKQSALRREELAGLPENIIHLVYYLRKINKGKIRNSYSRFATSRPYAPQKPYYARYGRYVPRLESVRSRQFMARRGYQGTGAMTRPSGYMRNLRISDPARGWMQVYGSPFSRDEDIPNGLGVPRRPDPDFSDISAGQVYDNRIPGSANYPWNVAGTGSAYIMASALPFAMSGLDIRGSQNLGGAVPSFPTSQSYAAQQTYLKNTFIPRITEGTQNYDKLMKTMADVTQQRVTGSGLKVHDVGPAETLAGSIFAKHINYQKFAQSIDQQMRDRYRASATDKLWEFYVTYGIGGLCDYYANAYFTVTDSVCRSIIETAVAAASPNGDIGHEFTGAQGATQRWNTKQTEVKFFDKHNTWAVYDPNTTMADDTTVTWAVALANNADLTVMYNDLWTTTPTSFRTVRTGSYYGWVAYYAAGPCMMCYPNYMPIVLGDLQNASLMGTSGNSLLCLQVDNFVKNSATSGRALNLYRKVWMEYQLSGTTILSPTNSPVDEGYQALVQITDKMPVSVEGFTFFKKLRDGIMKAVHFVVRHRSAIGTILGAAATFLA